MKQKFLGLIGFAAIIAMMVFNAQFTTNSNSGNFALSSIASIVMQTNANAEEGGTCMKGSFIGRKAKTGSVCVCPATNKYVTPQSCEEGGDGCTEISCD